MLVMASSWLLPPLQRAAETALLQHARCMLQTARTATHGAPVFYRKHRRTAALWSTMHDVRSWAQHADSIGASALHEAWRSAHVDDRHGAAADARGDVASSDSAAERAARAVMARIDHVMRSRRMAHGSGDHTTTTAHALCDARSLCADLDAVLQSEAQADAYLVYGQATHCGGVRKYKTWSHFHVPFSFARCLPLPLL